MSAPRLNAARLLAVRAVWLTPMVVASILMLFMTLFYIGAIVNPAGHLRGLPVVMVNQDTGEAVHGSHVNLGAEVASDLRKTHSVTSRLSLQQLSSAKAAARMNSNRAFAEIVIPASFSASLTSGYGLTSASASGSTSAASEPPTVELLTSPRAGSTGAQLATGVAEPALHQVSLALASQLSAEATERHRPPVAGFDTSNPLTVTTSDFRSVPPDSALGLSAFYISLLTLMCGFLGAVLVNSSIDAVLGYGASEVGPKWRQRIPVSISRWHTLLTKWAVALATVPILAGVMILIAAGLLHMNAPHVGELWLFASLAGIAVAAGTLAMFAAFGGLGQLLAMLLFVYLALASSGGTIPVQALPSFFRFAAGFEPLRQVLGGIRSILYFDAQGDAGLTRGVLLTSIWLVVWLLIGAVVAMWYDHKGMDRLNPDALEFIQRSANTYLAESQHAAAARDPSRHTDISPPRAIPGVTGQHLGASPAVHVGIPIAVSASE